MLEIDILRNSSQKNVEVLRGGFLRFWVSKRRPDTLLAKSMGPREHASHVSPTGCLDKLFVLIWLVVYVESGGSGGSPCVSLPINSVCKQHITRCPDGLHMIPRLTRQPLLHTQQSFGKCHLDTWY